MPAMSQCNSHLKGYAHLDRPPFRHPMTAEPLPWENPSTKQPDTDLSSVPGNKCRLQRRCTYESYSTKLAWSMERSFPRYPWRSEERRVGKECGRACGSGWSPENE